MIYELNLDDKIEVSKIKKFLADNSGILLEMKKQNILYTMLKMKR